MTPTQGAYSLHPAMHDITTATASPQLSDTNFTNEVGQAAPNDFQPSRATDESTSSGFLKNGYERSSGLVPSIMPPLIDRHLSAGNAATGHGYVGFGSLEIEKQNLQTLIPTNSQISHLVEYHEKCLLWYHGCVHGPTGVEQSLTRIKWFPAQIPRSSVVCASLLHHDSESHLHKRLCGAILGIP